MNIESESRALRRLAAQLVRDDVQADDLVQDTWVDTLVSPPDAGRPRGPWLRTVLRNRRVTGLRAQARRNRREQDREAPRPTPSAEQIQLARELVEHLAALPEPDRDLLTLRYWEALTLNECAERLGISASTVRSRHTRALSKLRDRLDTRTGGREAWLSAMAPWLAPTPAQATVLGPPLSLASLSVGGILASTCLWLLSGLNPGCNMDLDTSAPRDVVEDPSAAAQNEQEPVAEPPEAAARSMTVAHEVDFDADKHPCDRPILPKDAPSMTEAADQRGEPLTPKQSIAAWHECVKRHGPSSEYRSRNANPDGSVHPLLSVAMSVRHIWPAMRHCHTGSEPARVRLSYSFRLHEDGSMTVGDIRTVQHEGLTADERACVESSVYVAEVGLRRGDVTKMDLPAGTELEMPHLIEVELKDSTTEIIGSGPRPPSPLPFRDKSEFGEQLERCGSEPMGATLHWDPETRELLGVEPDASMGPKSGPCLTKLLEAQVKPRQVQFFPRTDADTYQHCTFSGQRGTCDTEPLFRAVKP